MGELTIQWPDEGAERIRAARGRLEQARRALAERSRHDVLSVLCAWLDGWRDSGSVRRRELVTQLATAAGYSRECVAAGLELGLQEWSGDALRRLTESEIDAHLASAADQHTELAPFDWIAVVLAGSIPMPTLLQCIAPLLVGSPVLVKSGSRDTVTARLVVASLAEHDAELSRCIEVVDCDSADAPAMAALLEAPCAVASGSDETIAQIRDRLSPRQRLVAYGHKLSIAIMGGETGKELDSHARALALDVALWDQQGCLSPVALYVIGGRDEARRIGAVVADALRELSMSLPRGELGAVDAAAAAAERSGAEMRRAAGGNVTLHGGAADGFDVVVEEGVGWRPAPLHRFLRVHPVADETELVSAIAPITPYLSAAAVAGLDAPRAEALGAELMALGASRVCAPGRMQAPPLDWHHDGLPVLLPMARFANLR